MDEQSLQLILQLEGENIEQLKGNLKGKQRDGEASDFEIALRTYQESLDAARTQLQDRLICQSIARAVAADAAVIQACAGEEAQAVQDRRLAVNLSGNASTRTAPAPTPGTAASTKQSKALDGDLLRRLERLNVSSAVIGTDIGGESSSWAKTRDPGRTADGEREETEACLICGDELVLSRLSQVPCSHRYCSVCLNSLFQSASVDESLFPPRCCSKPIPVDSYLDTLSTKIVATFKAKQIEFTTQNRTYCHRPKCSTFIPPQCIKNQLGKCISCNEKTCTICKGAPHENEDCPKDAGVQELLLLAREIGWQQCPLHLSSRVLLPLWQEVEDLRMRALG
ncbi:hypothetical protein CDD80_7258 [Ophiocordyceps camponoti-rufipedis]|uniref:RING-type domain-containing protein n=1 Tax=Ophiocordyceps camponoti-rufipedis TaxID=2004952 RepID=A0A2C5ZE74_9HYPO|nr:hypothetical protein CDD80_7258 [Ophiocordyceps camponoti-rufipedis]